MWGSVVHLSLSSIMALLGVPGHLPWLLFPWFSGFPQGKQHLHSVLRVSEIWMLLCNGSPIKVNTFLLRFQAGM